MLYKNVITSITLTIAIGLLTWVSVGLWSQRNSAHIKITNKELPDAFMEDVVALLLNKQGKLKLKIVSPKLIHFNENDTTQFFSPQLTLYRKSPKPWFISSKRAMATEGIENVDFWDQVNIHHAADENNPATLIKTQALTVYPNQNLAETHQEITLIQPSLIVKSKGMKADLNSGDINLLSQARGEYVPNP